MTNQESNDNVKQVEPPFDFKTTFHIRLPCTDIPDVAVMDKDAAKNVKLFYF